MSNFKTIIFCLILFFVHTVQSSQIIEIDDEDSDWKVPPIASSSTYDLPLETIFQDWKITPLNTEFAVKELDDFSKAPFEEKKKRLNNHYRKTSLLILMIAGGNIDDSGRAIARKMIRNRISLLQMLTNPERYREEEIETIDTLTTLYNNLSRIERSSIDKLNLQSIPGDSDDPLNRFNQLSTTCTDFHAQFRSCFPFDLEDSIGEE